MKTFLIRTGVLVVLFGIIAAVTGYATFRFLTFGKNIPVPDLKGKTVIEANSIVSKSRLYIKVVGENFDDTVPEGFVMSQNIPAGNEIKEGRTMGVVISKGPMVQKMPSFKGLTLTEAEELAYSKKLHVGRMMNVHSDSIEKNKVIAQKPGPEEKGGKELVLIVSDGPYETSYFCPDFRDKTLSQATELARSLGLPLETTGSGAVIVEQSPPPSTIVRSGGTVSVRLKPDE
jgi:serine/threonine-protein kinase